MHADGGTALTMQICCGPVDCALLVTLQSGAAHSPSNKSLLLLVMEPHFPFLAVNVVSDTKPVCFLSTPLVWCGFSHVVYLTDRVSKVVNRSASPRRQRMHTGYQ